MPGRAPRAVRRGRAITRRSPSPGCFDPIRDAGASEPSGTSGAGCAAEPPTDLGSRPVVRSARIAQDLDGRLPELMARAHVPGVSAVVFEERQLAWSGAFGMKHRDSAERVDNDTVYQAASLSKPAFAFAVMQLVR